MLDLGTANRTSLIMYLLITVLVIALFLDGNQALQSIQVGVEDTMFKLRGDREPSDKVVICALDDATTDRIGWPMDRDSLARLMGALKKAGATVVVCDFDWRYVERGPNPKSDSIFWPVLSTIVDNVVLPIQFTYADLGVSVPPPPASYSNATWTEPFPPGSAVRAQAMLGPEGHMADSATAVAGITPMLETDHIVRFAPLLIDYGGHAFASNALWGASLYQDVARTRWWLEPGTWIKIDEHEIPTDEHGRMMLNYLGGPQTFTYYSCADYLDDAEAAPSLAGKIAIVAPTGFAGTLTVRTRMAEEHPATELTATAIENILAGDYIRTPSYSALIDLFIMGLLGLLAAFVLPRVNLTYRFVVLGAALLVIVNLQYLMFASFGWLVQTFYPSVLVFCFMAASPFIKSKEERDALARAAKAQSKSRQAKARTSEPPDDASTRIDVPRYPTSASESTTLSAHDETSEVGNNTTTHVEAATSRLDGTQEPTRLVEPKAPDAPTKLIDTDDSRETHDGEGASEEEMAQQLSEEIGNSGTRGEDVDAEHEAVDRDPTPLPEPETEDRTTRVKDGTDSGLGDYLGRYRLLGEIGRGAMGVVYEGIDPAINRPVALKTVRLDLAVPPAEKEELRSRLLREAQSAGQLSHPNIVTIYDVGSQGDVHYIAMEFLKGYTLERAVQKKMSLNFKIFAKLMIQVCDALEYAHSSELVHRDVKPANIMVLDNFKVKVMDFGIARVMNSNMTQTGVALGTPSYISPEQLSGHGVDRRSDIFSLGVVMFELLTKEKPFAGESINKLIYNILNSAPRRPTQMDTNIPEPFNAICLRALEKDPNKRYQYASDLSRDLKDFIASLQPRRMVI